MSKKNTVKYRPYNKYFLLANSIFILLATTGCTTDNTNNGQTLNNGEKLTENNDPGYSQVLPQSDGAELSITYRCTGCGRCATVDPEHFSISRGSRRAEIISYENLDSAALDQAISYCPANAIKIS